MYRVEFNWTIPRTIPEGWRCPTCRRVYAPDVRECPHCTPMKKPEKVYIPANDVDYHG